MIFQDPMTALNPVFKVGDQIEEAMQAHDRFTNDQARRACRSSSEGAHPDAERRAQEYPHQFSGGMRQRVMIAMALSNSPAC